jgi:hypothetical protein
MLSQRQGLPHSNWPTTQPATAVIVEPDVTPKSIRLRKRHLDPHDRKKGRTPAPCRRCCLGSGLIQTQNATMAARTTADRKLTASLS